MKQTLNILTVLLCFLIDRAYSQEYPQRDWKRNSHPEQAGWDTTKFTQLTKYVIDSTQVTGMMIIHAGNVVYEFGDVSENSYIASCRKSILAILYGPYVLSGRINLAKTLQDMGIDDVGGLLPIEKTATVKDILQARSGVFHPASYPGDYLADAPKRGSVTPGSYWLYSNWDFNVAGYIFEKETKKSIYDEIQRQLAQPIHMQDWKRSLQHKEGDSTRSYYPAYPIWFSTRDMARIGLLMLRNGQWERKQVIDPKWISEMIKPITQYTEVNANTPAFRGSDYYFGYGLYWWLWQNTNDYRFQGSYAALGAMGQTITIFPKINAVVVYKTKETYQRETSYPARFRLLRLAGQCYKGLSNRVKAK